MLLEECGLITTGERVRKGNKGRYRQRLKVRNVGVIYASILKQQIVQKLTVLAA
ncbi:MAG: hypothetical protein ACE5KA_01580 [Nitrososphaerales archaeon]